MRMRLAVPLAALLAACGDSLAPDSVVAVRIASPMTMPSHGINGPGTEPIRITSTWTVMVAASGSAWVRVAAVRTRLTETGSGSVRLVDTFPATDILPGREVTLDQVSAASFPSRLYPGHWVGVTTVELLHASGTKEELTASFSFP